MKVDIGSNKVYEQIYNSFEWETHGVNQKGCNKMNEK